METPYGNEPDPFAGLSAQIQAIVCGGMGELALGEVELINDLAGQAGLAETVIKEQ